MNDGDVRLTDEERRVIGEIERHERARWSARGARLFRWMSPRRRRRRAAVSWSVILLGMVVMVIGLVVGQPVVGLVGFVLLLQAIGDRCRQVTPASAVAGVRRLLGLNGIVDS